MDSENSLVIAEKEVTQIVSKISKAMKYAEGIVIKTDADQENVVKAVIGIEKEEKRVDEQRRFFTEPLNVQVKKINGLFNPLIKGLGAAADVLRGKMSGYQMELDAKSKAAESKAMADLASGKIKNIETAVAHIEKVKAAEKTVRLDAATVSYADKIGFEISDLNAVPREYLVIDEKKVLAVVRAGIEIPGIKKITTKVATVRRN